MSDAKKAVTIRVTYTVQDEVPEDWDEDMIRFHFEENFCLDNFVERLHRKIEANPNRCQTCFIGEAEVVIPSPTTQPAGDDR